jgi:hypothetical protein
MIDPVPALVWRKSRDDRVLSLDFGVDTNDLSPVRGRVVIDIGTNSASKVPKTDSWPTC